MLKTITGSIRLRDDDMHAIGIDTAICIVTINWGRLLFRSEGQKLGILTV
jgi:hypothetical protein